ncbi:MAG: hypothetical protein QXU11_05155 [Thermoproteota archaeon]
MGSMERDGYAEASDWLETYSSLAENFVSKVMRRKGVLLDYRRETLHVAEEYVREEFKDAWRNPMQETIDSFMEALAYVSRVIVLNFGGKPVFYPRIGKAIVRNVAGLGIIAFPTVWLNRVIHAEPPAMLEDYYDRVAWLVGRLKTNSFNIDEGFFKTVMRISGYFHYISTEQNLHLSEHRNGTIAAFSFCPDCRKVAQVAHFFLPYEEITGLVELVRNIEVVALEPARKPCSKCRGWSLPLGYSYSAVMSKEKLDKSFLKESLAPLLGPEERVLTLVVSSLGKGFILSGLLKRGSDNRVKVEKHEELPLVELRVFHIFSLTPFCV